MWKQLNIQIKKKKKDPIKESKWTFKKNTMKKKEEFIFEKNPQGEKKEKKKGIFF